MDDPFILEARKRWTLAARRGRMAFWMFLCCVAAYAVFTSHFDDGGWWDLFSLAAVAFGALTYHALVERWIERNSARVAIAFSDYAKRLE